MRGAGARALPLPTPLPKPPHDRAYIKQACGERSRSRRRKGEVGGSGVGPTARLEAEAEAEAAASEHASLHTSSPLTPRWPKARDAGTVTTPCGLAPLARPANNAPVVVHVTEGPGREPLEIRVHLPNGFPGEMPSGYGSRPPPSTPRSRRHPYKGWSTTPYPLPPYR